eukprot:4621105-Lingulodinium_polyedra.AAC.1
MVAGLRCTSLAARLAASRACLSALASWSSGGRGLSSCCCSQERRSRWVCLTLLKRCPAGALGSVARAAS